MVVILVEKFGSDGFLERSWDLPPDVVGPLRAHVNVTPEGWIVDVWPVTTDVAAVLQPWIDEPIDVRSGALFVSSAQVEA
ncbi:hypothetical protein JQS43_24565 [Natronosporangium hydrolyticum]|uniref:Uncharacterized protein n=1 Tax=Natronosporangium hydrolyticum TaxID=2811111 RepID=A0A895YA09_9ACTN|nr:hypothetical protein [Natronosporangium hydrolyticum]QSB14604.1 hypothetical protein JQS43_24565 [Natronosporangium hydrolyticum]